MGECVTNIYTMMFDFRGLLWIVNARFPIDKGVVVQSFALEWCLLHMLFH